MTKILMFQNKAVHLHHQNETDVKMNEIEYYKLEQRNILDPENNRSVHRLKHKGRVDGNDFIKEVVHRSGYNKAVITGVLVGVAEELAEQLGSGFAVELPGIGVFSIGVKMKTDKKRGEEEMTETEGKTPDARSLRLDHINFRKNKDFFSEVDDYFGKQKISRVYGKEGVRIKKSKYPQVKNRMIVAREFLASHPFMTVRDYATITGLSYSAAQRELKTSWNDPAYGITAEGNGSHRVYILR